ncbi:TetR/AcrR family transcriptional regulator [uncultured Slackia sp.]|uniref:TetR/AcrR family transcriptional regulator n=1 Tax=uncultured Slackia sp. TaxID=665903 RepID=UPI0026755D07|nr:TetR/AcrR family transcriptional regulator [uncultured Slackia sp.]
MARVAQDEDNKEKILEAAGELIAEGGISRTSLRSICDKAGISTGTLYYHYRTKDLILADILRQNLSGPRWLAVEIEQGNLTRPEAFDKLISALRGRIEKLTASKVYTHMLDEALSGNEVLAKIVQEQNDDWIDALEEIIAFIKNMDTCLITRSAAIMIESLAQGITTQYLLNQDYEQKEETLDAVLETVKRVIRAI